MVKSGGRFALDDVRVEGIERADRVQAKAAAFWGVGVHIVELGEISRVLWRTVHGDCMAGLGDGGVCEDHGQHECRGTRACQWEKPCQYLFLTIHSERVC